MPERRMEETVKLLCLAALVAVLCTASVPGAAWAQSASTGVIAGDVKDATGAVLPGVTIEAASPAPMKKVRPAATAAQGRYSIIELRPGTNTVTFSLPGFATVRGGGIELPASFTAVTNAVMRVGGVEE